MTINKLLLIVATVLLAALGCAGADWLIHGHESPAVALAGFAGACWVASSIDWPPARPKSQ